MVAPAHLSRNVLVEQHLGLARLLAGRLSCRLPRHVDVEELESDAYLGLIQAAESFNRDCGVLFRSYAAKRITGAILDGMRQRGQLRRTSTPGRVLSLDCAVGTDGATLGEMLAGDGRPVGAAIELRDQTEFLLSHLKPVDRRRVVNCCMRGISRKQAARKAGISASLMSRKVLGALDRLREVARG